VKHRPGGQVVKRSYCISDVEQYIGLAALGLCPEPAILRRMIPDRSLLEAALIGYEAQVRRIEASIAEIKRQLGATSAPEPLPTSSARPRKKRTSRISPEGRARIAEAQRRRWAEAKKARLKVARG
jgi:hypothetical protein